MKKQILFAFIYVIGLSANAQFSAIYAPSNWTTFWLFPSTNGSVNTSGAPGSITITGDNDCSGDFDQFVEYSITVPYCGLFSFSYDWTNADASTAEESYYSINNVFTLISNPSASGNIGPIFLAAGDEISFIVNSPGLSECAGSGTLTITNFVAPSAPFLFNATASQFTTCSGGIVIVSASNAANYNWSTGTSGTIDSIMVTVTSDTLITVTGTDLATGCSVTDSVSINMIDCSGAENYSQHIADIYPNPAADFLFIDSEMDDLSFNICDIQGKQILNGQLLSDKFISLQGLNSGLYVISIYNKESIQKIKLLKE